jgi:hypothetical protein
LKLELSDYTKMTDLSLSEQFQIASQYSVDSKSRAIFYSGDNGRNHKRAVNCVGKIPIDRTEAGRKLYGIYQQNNQRYRSVKAKHLSKNVMSTASHRYAANARGDVKTFVCGAKPDSVFRQTELPMIARNKHITSINGVNRKHFEKAFKQDPSGNKAYHMVCRAELRRDQYIGEKTRDKNLLADVDKRLNLYGNKFPRNKSNAPSNDRAASLINNSRTPVAKSQQPKTSRSIGNSSTNPSSSQSLTKTPSPSTKPKTETRSQTPPPPQSPKRSR